MKRTELERRTPLARTSRLRVKPKSRLPRALRDLERRLRERWAAHARAGTCAVCDSCDHVRGHHAIEKQALKRICRALGLDEEATLRVLWDLRNLMRACDRCHHNHHFGTRRIPRAVVLGACPKLTQFLAELDAGWLLDRTYSEPTA